MAFVRKLRRFREMDARFKWRLADAYVKLGVMRLLVLLVPFNSLVRTLERDDKTPLPDIDADQAGLALEIGQAVAVAAAHTPWKSACLVQALVAQRMLKKRRIPGVLYLGASVGANRTNPLLAHAWLKCGAHIVTGEGGHDQYTVMTSYHW